MLLAWYVVSELQIVRSVFLPRPSDVISAFGRSVADGSIVIDAAISAYRVFAGFLIAFAVAVPLGVLIGISSKFRECFEPFNDFFRYVPVPAVVPLLILWLGIGNPTQMAVIAFGTMPQLTVLVADTISRMPIVYQELGAVLHFSKFQYLANVTWPYASPGIYDSARVTIGWAWSYLLVAEIVAANRGIGQSIIIAQRFLRTDQVVVGILVISLLGLTIDRLLRFCYPFFFPWMLEVGRGKGRDNASAA